MSARKSARRVRVGDSAAAYAARYAAGPVPSLSIDDPTPVSLTPSTISTAMPIRSASAAGSSPSVEPAMKIPVKAVPVFIAAIVSGISRDSVCVLVALADRTKLRTRAWPASVKLRM